MVRTPCIAAVLVLLVVAVVGADEAADAFNSLFAGDLKRVAATPSTGDDVELARKLLDAAATVKAQPALLALLCEKAYELGAKDSSGYATARAAMELEAATTAEKKLECEKKCMVLLQRQFSLASGDAKATAGEALLASYAGLAERQAAAGDTEGAIESLRQALGVAVAINSPAKADIQARYGALFVRRDREKQAVALRDKLEANPEDGAARKELVRLCLVEMDNPAEAGKFVDASFDESTRKYVPAAARPPEEAPELACQELGKWYEGLVAQASGPTAKAAMLGRAKGYYERFLQLHAEEGLSRTTAVLALKKVEDALAKLAPAAPKPPAQDSWTDCLKLVDPAKHAVLGSWQKKDGELWSSDQVRFARIMLPVAIQGSYELQATFVRKAGNNSIAFCLPVGTTACLLNLSSYSGRFSGIEMINGVDARSNPTSVQPGTLENGEEYTVGVKVLCKGSVADIRVTMNGKPFVQWTGPMSALAIHNDWSLPDPKCPGLAKVDSKVVFTRVACRPLKD